MIHITRLKRSEHFHFWRVTSTYTSSKRQSITFEPIKLVISIGLTEFRSDTEAQKLPPWFSNTTDLTDALRFNLDETQ
jgi:hypothetical protein